ncbi:metallophosphoesterase family protein [Cognatishimia sp.]|uniref:metallophosphoesterase family protein n=1 Tax=Cognatishimia sp. TaxID=2211648 RepID=UPI003515DBA0
MAGLFNRLFQGRKAQERAEPVRVEMPPLAVERPIAIIGDLHGCYELTQGLLTKIQGLAPDAELVFVGDYVDRGENSAEVLRLLMDMPDAVCLKGNHEQMMLDFLENPEEKGARWLRYGGLQTVASFGCTTPVDQLRALRDEVLEAMGDDMVHWMQYLPLMHINGNLSVVHAAAHPEHPITAQDENTLMWGHPKFEHIGRQDGIWVAHGHTIVQIPTVQNGRIAVDTGAYATGKLTAAIIQKTEVEFCQIRG